MSDFGYAMIMVVFSMTVVVGLALSIFSLCLFYELPRFVRKQRAVFF